jgi:hypothetical protein
MKKLLEVVVLCGAAIVFLATCARSQQIGELVGTAEAGCRAGQGFCFFAAASPGKDHNPGR